MYRLPNNLSSEPSGPEAFLPGQLVRHKRYHYRGVIVSVDSQCLADNAWYYSNQTQPERNQPWYHVLVDNSSATTYAAHSSLEQDPQRTEISHPLITTYFDSFNDGHYNRNDTPWPS